MGEDILDDDLIFQNKKEVQSILLNWTSIIILWIGIIWCFINGLIFNTQVVGALILLVISTILSYINFNLGVKITLGIIFLGTFSLIGFFPIKEEVSFTINGFGLGFELILFVIGIIHYFTNRKRVSKFFKKWLNRDISEEEIKSAKRSRIDGFKRR